MEKKKRTQCLRNFTRSVTVFDDVSTKNIPFDLVKKAFDKVESCYEKLEAAQDEYILVAAEEETDDYLAAPGVSYQRILGAFGAFQQKSADDDKREEAYQVAEVAEKERQDRELKFTEEKVQFELEMENFARLNLGFTDMMEDASDSDKRKQLEKLQGIWIPCRRSWCCWENLIHRKISQPSKMYSTHRSRLPSRRIRSFYCLP